LRRSIGANVPELRLSLWGFGLNAVWEAAQSALYTDSGGGIWYLVRTRLHCTAGDVLILLASFELMALGFRDRHWADRPSWPSALLFVAVGLTYTVWSEIHNTQIVRTWAYAAAMPQFGGIGLTPFLQWLVIPPFLVVMLRRKGPEGGNE
jgi:hypothetical protein